MCTLRRLAVGVLLAVLAAGAAGEGELGDISFQRKGTASGDISPATFPHWLHRMQYKCTACHDAPFKMKAGANVITMDVISNGKMCGECHDGKTAFPATFNTCNRCHRQ